MTKKTELRIYNMVTLIMRISGNRWFTSRMIHFYGRPSELQNIGGDPASLLVAMHKLGLVDKGKSSHVSFSSKCPRQGKWSYKLNEKGHKFWIGFGNIDPKIF